MMLLLIVKGTKIVSSVTSRAIEQSNANKQMIAVMQVMTNQRNRVVYYVKSENATGNVIWSLKEKWPCGSLS
jgi:hypothetical protein